MIKRLFHKNDASLDAQVASAKEGDDEARNEMLKQYQPFIAKSVSEVCKRYIDPARDDEFSIGLLAFNEAIQSYSSAKGSSFLSFARLVIKRKVIDYIRNEQKRPPVTSLDEDFHEEEQMENPLEISAARERHQLETEAWHRREEILEFQQDLKRYKLSFEELIEVSPKHRDARESAVHVARLVYDDYDLRMQVLEKGRLPIKDLVGRVDVSKKTLERNRKFIIALVLIFKGDYIYLKDYLKGVGM
ncbi:RNA polymerase sigma factor SigI [Halobacillus litoralis]|uniref:RNA polymerase sigma factor SigI n=1 Tax=Halobacillus litoralis TaxID=45668 RepID=A0A845DLT0_9BACI|nr:MULTISPECIES: RNA polymerase sigma factor SigI [Halobacillus]MCA1022643.1 RNA polymerase sigma factor SigI [Halobacillus litoralis]MYL18313.1 RNA polymerase sigma factor SigI [Halobacillus litoralis]MYL30679.1 RNA polymerase sigma factor SigI [Halobacillus halophilus]MYL38697.1 RNA polymerase sigma factor SigI [Halobacillus litoralis]